MPSVALVSLLLSVGLAFADDGADDRRLYARVTTTDGRVVEGYLRWDRNEGSTADFLDGAREIPRAVLQQAERLDPEYGAEMRRARSLVAFGVRITWAEDDMADPSLAPTAVRMARVAEIVPLEGRRARVGLVDGEDVELVAVSTDLGPGVRDVVVETRDGGRVTLEWEELERVELMAPPPDVAPPAEERLSGTLTTVAGVEATGLVSWDLDEGFPSDVLDGRDEVGDRSIPFEEIFAIEPVDAWSSRVRLRSGEVVLLRGSNDVNRQNRGVEVVDPRLGRIRADWDALAALRFHGPTGEAGASDDTGAPGSTGAARPDRAADTGLQDRPGAAAPPDRMDGPTPTDQAAGTPLPDRADDASIRGTVHARDGRVLSGALRWGHEETARWELLDGRLEDVEVGVEFASVAEIRPDGPDGSWVELRNGRTLRLHGTDDVGPGHRGVFVTPEGRATRLVRWADVQRVVLDP